MTQKKATGLWITFVISSLSMLVFNSWWIGEVLPGPAWFIVTIATVVSFLGLFPAVGMWLQSKTIK